MSRYYPGFLGGTFHRPAPDRDRLAFPVRGVREGRVDRRRQRAVLGRDLPAERDRPARPVFPRDGAGRRRPGDCSTRRAEGGLEGRRRRGSPTTIGFTQEQRSKAQKILDENLQWADYWFNDPENAEKRQKYYPRPGPGRADRARPGGAVVPERAGLGRAPGPGRRPPLVDRSPLVERGKALRDAVAKLATPEQVEDRAGSRPSQSRWTSLDVHQHADDVRPDRDRVLPDRWAF